MRKLRLYLDTSVISDIGAAAERGAVTREFFRIVAQNPDDYELVVSPALLRELNKAPAEKRQALFTTLRSLDYVEIPEQMEVDDLAKRYVAAGVLSDKHIVDLTHVAYAVLTRCDYIISWNMKHIVRAKTISSVQEFNRLNYYHSPNIATPIIITGEKSYASD